MEAQDKARQDLAKYKQEHILADVDKLKGQDLENFNASLNEIDFGLMDMLYNELILHPSGDDLGSDITPMKNKFRLNNFTNEEIEKLRQTGLELISQGKVGIVLLSGGQGTRLGFDHAKGMYNIGMPSGKSLFEYFANRIARINEIACQAFNVTGKKPSLTWYVMTSEMNHSEIIGYFTEKNYFGLGQENVKFFTQQSLPALHLDGKIMLEEENKINMSPNGNGGLFHSLLRHGVLKDMRDRGIKYVHIFGVDNVLAKPADPLFIGFTHANDYDVACKFVPKKSPTERVGVHVLHSGKPHVVEYSEITEEMAHRRDEQGTLVFDASHIVNSVYNIDFLDYVATHGSKELIKKYHIAKKKIKYYDVNIKQVVNPSDINGYKFELFIFDVFLLAKPEKFGLIEVKREEEFAPVKNAPGAADDSPDTARELLTTLHQKWLEERGVKFDNKASKEEGALFEIDTAKVYDAKDPRLNDIAEKHKDASIKLPNFLTE